MKKLFFIVFLVLFFISSGDATGKSFSFYCKRKIVGKFVRYENKLHTYNFRIEVISDYGGVKPEYNYGRAPFIRAKMGERYSVRIYNPLPVRVAVNLTIDGLNTITGAPCTPSGGDKWLIAPHNSIVVKGWQVNTQNMRRFYFTTKSNSYAKWRSYQFGKDLSVKCGVISASYFWNKKELETYLANYNPIYIHHHGYKKSWRKEQSEDFAGKKMRCRPPMPRENAGTGMGERGGNAVEYVNFHYNTGMYGHHESVKIYYDFIYHRIYKPKYPKYGRFAPEKP